MKYAMTCDVVRGKVHGVKYERAENDYTVSEECVWSAIPLDTFQELHAWAKDLPDGRHTLACKVHRNVSHVRLVGSDVLAPDPVPASATAVPAVQPDAVRQHRPGAVQGPYTPERFKWLLEEVYTKLNELTATKGTEYRVGDQDQLANFKRLAQELDTTPDKVCWQYLRKHLDAVLYVVRGHSELSETLDSRIMDSILYLVLLMAICREKAIGQQ